MRKLILFVLLVVGGWSYGQENHAPVKMTNANIVGMVKAGMSSETVILVLHQNSTDFDTSPDALIELKKQGVPDDVLNAMLAASTAPKPPDSAAAAADDGASRLLDKAAAAIGNPEKLAGALSLRAKGTMMQTTANSTASSRVERLIIFPDTAQIIIQLASGMTTTVVVTPQTNYLISGKMRSAVPTNLMDDLRNNAKLDPIYVAQHRSSYTCSLDGAEQIGEIRASRLRITRDGQEFRWSIDPSTGRVLRLRFNSVVNGETVTDFSDWRTIDGIAVPFKRHTAYGQKMLDLALSEFEINPVIDPTAFQPPSQPLGAAFTIKVLQSESVPYVVQSGGRVNTNCQISGSTTTSLSAFTAGNLTTGTATSTPNLQMNCSSTESSVRWRHVLNAMLVEASDGNAYIIACDRAWRWSKCSGLKPGDVFGAQHTDKGFVVQFFNTKQQEKEATYAVLEAKSLH